MLPIDPMNKGDGIAEAWLGHPVFKDREGRELIVRRMPAFFETFPGLLKVISVKLSIR